MLEHSHAYAYLLWLYQGLDIFMKQQHIKLRKFAVLQYRKAWTHPRI